MQTQLLIGGDWSRVEGAAEAVLDGASGAQIAAVPEASAAQVHAAVMAAETAFSGLGAHGSRDRAALLLRIAEHI